MDYEHFSRHLREKYATRFHVADQLVDQLKQQPLVWRSSTPTQELNQKNLMRAQREIAFPLISYLNQFEGDRTKSAEKNNEFEPYFNECLLAAERIKNNRRSQRDRQICYENWVLTQKLERIKNPAKNRGRQNHRQLLLAKVNDRKDSIELAPKPSQPSNAMSFDRKLFSETIISCHSSLLEGSGSDTASLTNEDDQATAADVDGTLESNESQTSLLPKQRKIRQQNRNVNCAQSDVVVHGKHNSTKQPFSAISGDRVYQHLCDIDGAMVRDTKPLLAPSVARHLSISILPRCEPEMAMPGMVSRPKAVPDNQKCAFKREILQR